MERGLRDAPPAEASPASGLSGGPPSSALSQVAVRRPERVGSYRILDRLAQGGMGVIYRAEHIETGEQIALKTLRALEPAHLEGLRREMRALSRIQHPGVVRILSEGIEQGIPWYAMEFVDGETLQSWWRRERRLHEPPPASLLHESLRVLCQLCRTLACLHGDGIVHRDLKPSNVIVRPDGTPVLVDFGLASQFAGSIAREALEVGGELLGTIDYMAPEQVRGEYVDARADLYALGCILYEAATGDPPFTGAPGDVLRQHLESEPLPPSQRVSSVSPQLDTLVMGLLAKEPHRRLGYADDVARELATLAPGNDEAPAAPRSYLYRPSFAGRRDVLSLMVSRLERAARGEGNFTLVGGESGVGKTRLAMEVTREATRLGFTVVTGQCLPVEGAINASEIRGSPLHPFQPLLRSVADHCRQAGLEMAERVLGRRGRVLAAYESALGDLPGQADHPEPVELPAQAARTRVLSDLRESLRAFAREVPLLLVLDDLQWADELSLAFLSEIPAEFLEGTRLLILGAYRSEEMNDAIRELARSPLVMPTELGRLDASTLGSIVADMLALHPPPAPLVRFLAKESEGNPFFVSEYLRTAVDAQLLRRGRLGHWQIMAAGRHEEVSFESLSLPRTLQELLGRRLEDLTPPALATLESAAILGREFELPLAAAMAGLDEPRRLDAATQLLVRHIIEEIDGTRFRFTHDKVREVAYSRIPLQRAGPLHGIAASLIEARQAADPDSPQYLARLAHHWSIAGIQEKALEYFGKAGEHSLKTGAHTEAHALLSRALEIDDRIGRRAGRLQRARWLRMLGEAAFGLGDFEGSIEHTSTALSQVGQQIPRTRAGCLGLTATQLVRQMSHRVLPAALVRSGSARRALYLEASLAAGQFATTVYYRGDSLQSVANLLRAVNLAEQAGAPSSLSLAYARLGYVAGTAGLHPMARVYFRRAKAQAGGSGDASGLGLSLYLEAFYLLSVAEWERSRVTGERAVQLLEGIGDRQEGEVARTMVGHSFYYAGRFEEARERFAAMLESARARSHRHHIAWGLFLAGRSLLALGHIEDAIRLLRDGHEMLLPFAHIDRTSVMCEGLLAVALLRVGQLEQAKALAASLGRGLREHPPPPIAPCVDAYACLAEVYLSLWKLDVGGGPNSVLARAARDACVHLRRFARTLPMARPAALRSSALEQWLLGHVAQAERTWLRAVRAAAERGMPYDEALGHRDLARFVARPAEAERHRERARQLLLQLGCIDPDRQVAGA